VAAITAAGRLPAAQTPAPRTRDFAADQYWQGRDAHWEQTQAAVERAAGMTGGG